MSGNAQAHRALAAGNAIGDAGRALQHERKRTGPERRGQSTRGRRNIRRPQRQLRDVGEMHDQRMVLRPAFGREDLRHRGGIGGVGAETIDGLGGKGHQSARPQDRGGTLAFGWGGDSGPARGVVCLSSAARTRPARGQNQLVSRRSASRYFSAVLAMMSAGRRGAGAFLFHGCFSSQLRTNCLSNEGGLMPTLYSATGQKREESEVRISSIK